MLLIAGCSPQQDENEKGKVIVLMYHRITSGTATNLYERSVADLEGDLIYLKEHNIKVIDFDDLPMMVSGGVIPETDCAILTFDDGDHSWYDYVMPLVIKYRVKATFFLWTAMMDRDSFLSWEEVEYMSHYIDASGENPFTFGSHTMDHQYLLDRKSSFNSLQAYNEYLDEELGGSRKMIEAHTPVEVKALSLPYGNGAGDMDIIEGAIRNGYKYIRTSEWSAFDPVSLYLMRIPSLPILNDTDPKVISTYLSN